MDILSLLPIDSLQRNEIQYWWKNSGRNLKTNVCSLCSRHEIIFHLSIFVLPFFHRSEQFTVSLFWLSWDVYLTLSQTLFPQNDSNSHFVLHFPRVHFSEVWREQSNFRSVCVSRHFPSYCFWFFCCVYSLWYIMMILSSQNENFQNFCWVEKRGQGAKVREAEKKIFTSYKFLIDFHFLSLYNWKYFVPLIILLKGSMKCIFLFSLLFSSLLSSHWKMKMTFFLLQHFDV